MAVHLEFAGDLGLVAIRLAIHRLHRQGFPGLGVMEAFGLVRHGKIISREDDLVFQIDVGETLGIDGVRAPALAQRLGDRVLEHVHVP